MGWPHVWRDTSAFGRRRLKFNGFDERAFYALQDSGDQ